MKTMVLVALGVGMLYGQVDGSLSREAIGVIRGQAGLTEHDRVTMNALTRNPLKELVIDHEFVSRHNDYYSNKIDVKGITDQQSSGRCWLFAVLNVLRAKVIQKYALSEFELSQNYLYFWDKVEKANYFLEQIIATADRDLLDRELVFFLEGPFNDGGYWSYVVNLIDKYGAVPKDAMPETFNSTESWVMCDLIGRILREDAQVLRALHEQGASAAELDARKLEMLKTVYRMLVLNLGEPPREFIWRYAGKEGKLSEPHRYTPQEFYREVVGVNLHAYVPLMNHPGKLMNTLYRFRSGGNVVGAGEPSYVNVDIATMRECAVKAVIAGEPMYFACDIVPDKCQDLGILSTRVYDYEGFYGIEYRASKAQRIEYRESVGNHAMTLVGVDVEAGLPVKWRVEDSHGVDAAKEGYWAMYDDWFDEYVYEVVVPVRFVPKHIAAVLATEPVMIEPWEPMARALWISDR